MRAVVVALGITLAAGAWAKAGDPPASGNSTVGKGNMMHCPTSVPNAKVNVADIKDGVEISVVGETEAAATEIRRRAQHCVESAKTDPNSVRHTGDGHGGGGLGLCPVVLKDTLVSADDIKGGSKITVRPIKPVDLEWLRKEVATRLKSKK
jgi:hypothetical protein